MQKGLLQGMEIGYTMQISCLWYDHIYGAVEFYAIALLICDVKYDITTTHWLRSAGYICHVFVVI